MKLLAFLYDLLHNETFLICTLVSAVIGGSLALVHFADRGTVTWHAPDDIHCPSSRDMERTCVSGDRLYTCINSYSGRDLDIYCAKKVTP